MRTKLLFKAILIITIVCLVILFLQYQLQVDIGTGRRQDIGKVVLVDSQTEEHASEMNNNNNKKRDFWEQQFCENVSSDDVLIPANNMSPALDRFIHFSMLPLNLGRVLMLNASVEQINNLLGEKRQRLSQTVASTLSGLSTQMFDTVFAINLVAGNAKVEMEALYERLEEGGYLNMYIQYQGPNAVLSLKDWNCFKRRFTIIHESPVTEGSYVVLQKTQEKIVENPALFHLIWSTSAAGYNQSVQGRIIESIFANHDKSTAEVRIYSNSLTKDHFNRFLQLGCNVIVIPFDLGTILKDTILEGFEHKFLKYQQHRNYYSHVTDVARMALLWKYGGIYLDYDALVNKNLLSMRNSIADQDTTNTNGAILIFDKHHPFMAYNMYRIPMDHHIDSWESIGPKLFKQTVERWETLSSTHVVKVNHVNLEQINFNAIMKRSTSATVFRFVEDGLGVFYRAMQSGYHINNRAVTKADGFNPKELEETINRAAAYHIYNGWVQFKGSYESGSYLDRLFEKNCFFCKFRQQ